MVSLDMESLRAKELRLEKEKRRATAFRLSLSLVVVFVLACASMNAKQNSAENAKTGEKKLEEVNISFKHLRRDLGEKRITFVEGDVKCIHGDTVLTTESATVDEKEQIITVPGKITITSPECDIVADRGIAYLKKRLAVLEGNVVMHLKPKTEEIDGNSERAKYSRPTTITCEKIEYLYRKKVASGTGNVIFKQDKRTATAKKFIYDEKSEILTIMGDVKAVDEDGQTFYAPEKVVICLKKGNEYMEASNAGATIKVDMSEEE